MKKRIMLAILLLTASLLSGCAMQTVEEMYALPKRSEEYNHLQTAIDGAMDGLTYCAPQSGENQQSVQMADLDGDGVEEYLVFATGVSQKPLQVLIFKQEPDGSCHLMETIESNGTAFEQVQYVELDDKPGCELVLGRLVSDQVLRSVTVHSFSSGRAELLMMNGYSKFLTCDLNEDGCRELMVFRPGEAETQRGMAVLYSFSGGQIQRSVEMELSEETDSIRRITPGRLQDGTPAVFVASSVGESAIVTDIFALKDGQFTNISFSGMADTSVRTLRNFYIYADDIDNDGVLELPSLITMKPISEWKEGDQRFLIRWFAIDLDGWEVDKLLTFHNYEGGWYVQLNNTWASRVTVEQDNDTYSFFVWDETYQICTPLFNIYVLTAANRNELAAQGGRFVLHRTEGVTFAAKLAQDAVDYDITPDYLIQCFRLIRQEWRTGET